MSLLGFLFTYRIPLNIFCIVALVVIFFQFYILSVSVCPWSSLSFLPLWMTALLDKVFLASCSSHLVPWICLPSPYWPAMFLWIGLMLFWCSSSVHKEPLLLSFSQDSFFFSKIFKLHYYMLGCWSVFFFFWQESFLPLEHKCLFPSPD